MHEKSIKPSVNQKWKKKIREKGTEMQKKKPVH